MITKILSKYEGYRNYWYPEVKEKNLYIEESIIYVSYSLEEKYSEGCCEKERELNQKWKNYIGENWYGFSLGKPCPHDWYKIIDEFLDYLVSLQNDGKINDFRIYQIKMKFGGLRFYIYYSCDDGELIEHIGLQIQALENHLFDEKLIY